MPDHNVTTHRNDTSRSGAYLAETELTPATVASSQFGKLYERIVNVTIRKSRGAHAGERRDRFSVVTP